MAEIIALPRAKTDRVVQTRIAGRLPNSVTSLRAIKRKKFFAASEANAIAAQIDEYEKAIDWANGYVRDYQFQIISLKRRRQEVLK